MAAHGLRGVRVVLFQSKCHRTIGLYDPGCCFWKMPSQREHAREYCDQHTDYLVIVGVWRPLWSYIACNIEANKHIVANWLISLRPPARESCDTLSLTIAQYAWDINKWKISLSLHATLPSSLLQNQHEILELHMFVNKSNLKLSHWCSHQT